MESFDQITALTFVGDQRFAAQVDYQICDRCGFRLKRVETTIISNQRLIAEHCPICEQFDIENLNDSSVLILTEDILHCFDLWLGTHGLDRETLDVHYHLKAKHFFDQSK